MHYQLGQSINTNNSSTYRRKVNEESLARLGINLENYDWLCVHTNKDINSSYENFVHILNNQLDINRGVPVTSFFR